MIFIINKILLEAYKLRIYKLHIYSYVAAHRKLPGYATLSRRTIDVHHERGRGHGFFLEVPSEPDYVFHRADAHAPHRMPIGMTAKSFGGALVPRFIGMRFLFGGPCQVSQCSHR